jgi:3-oxoacyl-[acyl-carrier protein] reductase
VTDSQWAEVLNVNLTGAFYMTRALLPQMISQGYGRIVNVSSVWGMVGGAMEAPYSAAKAGLIGLTKALAKEAGPAGITVNALAPGATKTDMLAAYGGETLRQIALDTPLGRLCEPEDIASAALWLCGDSAAMVTGQVLCISGGNVIA